MLVTSISNFSTTSFIFAIILLFYVFNNVLKRSRRRKVSLNNGCKAGKAYKQADPYLGLFLLYRGFKDFRARKFLHAWHQRLETTGRTIWVWLLGSRMLVTSDPENMKTILATSSDQFEHGPHKRAAFGVLGNGIFSAEGKHWQQSRALFRPSFAREEIYDTGRFETYFQKFLQLLPTDGTLVDLQPLFDRLTMDTVTDLFFGTSSASLSAESNEEASKFYKSAKYCLRAIFRDLNMGVLGRMLPDRTYTRARKHIYKTVDKYVHAALESNAKAVLNDGSVTNCDQHKRYILLKELVERAKDPILLRDESVSALLGGTETTASLLSNLLYLLSRRPEVWRQLRAEALEFGDKALNRDHMKEAVYLSYCISESLRLYPTVPYTIRWCNKDTILPRGGGSDELSPLLVPRGTSVYLAFYPMHRRKDIFGEDADEFKPERWATLRPGWGFLPFLGGPRVCLGQQFALAEATYTMLRLLQTYETIEAIDDKPWVENLGITMNSASGCKVRLHAAPTA